MSASAKVMCALVCTPAPCAYTSRILASHFLPVSSFLERKPSQLRKRTPTLVTVLRVFNAHARMPTLGNASRPSRYLCRAFAKY